jgi:DNA polymerase-3 subunit alpha
MNRSSLKFTPETCPIAAVDDNRRNDVSSEAATIGAHQTSLQSIRYGLAAIKNVGEGAMASAIAERERGGDFTSLTDFCSRVDARLANRKIIESLVKAGAFDFLGRERAELFACIEETLAAAAASHRDRAAGQVSLFGDLPPPTIVRAAHAYPKWTQRETLSFEKELLGFYVTGHPLDAYAPLFASGNYQSVASLGELLDRASFRIAGAITQVDRKFTKKEGKPFAVVFLEDLTGTIEVVLWNETYVTVSHALEPGAVIAIRGTLDRREDTVRATAQKVKVLKPEPSMASPNDPEPTNGSGRPHADAPITLRFGAGAARDELRAVRNILASSPGSQPVTLMMTSRDGGTVRIAAGDTCRIDFTPAIEQQLAPWLG